MACCSPSLPSPPFSEPLARWGGGVSIVAALVSRCWHLHLNMLLDRSSLTKTANLIVQTSQTTDASFAIPLHYNGQYFLQAVDPDHHPAVVAIKATVSPDLLHRRLGHASILDAHNNLQHVIMKDVRVHDSLRIIGNRLERDEDGASVVWLVCTMRLAVLVLKTSGRFLWPHSPPSPRSPPLEEIPIVIRTTERPHEQIRPR